MKNASLWRDAMCIEDKYDQFDGDEEEKKYNGRYPKEIIEETEDLDFIIYLLCDRKRKLSDKSRMATKIDSCIKHLEFLKEIDDKYLWLTRDYDMLQISHDEVCRENSKLHDIIEKNKCECEWIE